MRLKEIRKHYPLANYEPNPSCQMCKGTGQIIKSKISIGYRPCICTYVDHPEFARIAQDIFNKMAIEHRKNRKL